MPLSNDARGWIMTSISGVACVLGASIICADLIIRLFPSKRNFKIQDSDKFLSSSLSLSFGVMLFSALYTMLPSAKSSLQKGGFSPKAAAWTLIGCFIGGVIGIQIISRVLHRFMPSHVVDCEHSHDEEAGKDDHEHDHEHEHHHSKADGHSHHAQRQEFQRSTSRAHRPRFGANKASSENPSSYFAHQNRRISEPTQEPELGNGETSRTAPSRRPSLQARLTATISKLTSGSKEACDGDGPCFGISEPCGQECFKYVQSRGSFRAARQAGSRRAQRPAAMRGESTPVMTQTTESTPLLHDIFEEPTRRSPLKSQHRSESAVSASDAPAEPGNADGGEEASLSRHKSGGEASGSGSDEHADNNQHHHHVPTNAFLSIGLQTSLAIALHKLPEGFITYATNHANPTLGFSVFLALFIHNITEGFAMALPLYLALNSRWKAMFWSSLLGGFSQPLGAGVAALWFKLAGSGDLAPGEAVYGGMFAVTAGIMASVALQLFSESLIMTHNRELCMVFAFVGMGILGISSALTA